MHISLYLCIQTFFISYIFMHSSLYKHGRLSVRPFTKPFAKSAHGRHDPLCAANAALRHCRSGKTCGTLSRKTSGRSSRNELWKYIKIPER